MQPVRECAISPLSPGKERGRVRGCLVSVMQDGNEFATLCCSQAILERLTSENAGPSRKIRSLTRAGQRLLARQWRGVKTKGVMHLAVFIQGGGTQELDRGKANGSVLAETWRQPERASRSSCVCSRSHYTP